MKHIVITFLILVTYLCNSQESKLVVPTKQGLTESELKIAKEKFYLMVQTQLYLDDQTLNQQWASRLNVNSMEPEDYLFLNSEESYSKWLSKNLSKTRYSTIDEAVNARNQCLASKDKLRAINSELYELMARATIDQLTEIARPKVDAYLRSKN